jgi:hypothetical protein
VLALAEGDLDLRDQVDVRGSICDEIVVRNQLEHWSPHAAEAAIDAKRFASRKANEPGARGQVAVRALLEPALPLQKVLPGNSCPNVTFASKIVVPVPSPLSLFPAGSVTTPSALTIDPLCGFENST